MGRLQELHDLRYKLEDPLFFWLFVLTGQEAFREHFLKEGLRKPGPPPGGASGTGGYPPRPIEPPAHLLHWPVQVRGRHYIMKRDLQTGVRGIDRTMVKVVIGDIFQSNAQTLVNEVDCVGRMAKGIALEFKKRFPDVYRDYLRRSRAKDVKLGQPYLLLRVLQPWVLNFPTKKNSRSVAQLRDIVRGLDHLERCCREWGITSLAVPAVGCGKGQLEWRVVGPRLYRQLKRLSIPVELYAPSETPREELQRTYLEHAMLGEE